MRVVARLCGVGLLFASFGCASSSEPDEGFDPVQGTYVPGPDIREGGLTETLPWNGEGRTVAITVAANREAPRNLKVSTRYLLWTEYPADGTPWLALMDKVTGHVEFRSTEGTLPWSVAHDGDEIFWADPIAEVLWSIGVDGGAPIKVDAPEGVALVAADRSGPVWANFDGTVWMRDRATNFVSRIASGPGIPQTIVLDDDRVYWVSGAVGKLFSVARTGGPVKDLAAVGSDVTQIGFIGKDIAWVDPETGTVLAVPRAGGVQRELMTGIHGATAAAFDAESVWVLAGVQGAQLLRIPVDGRPMTSHVRGLTGVTELASDGAFVYAVDAETNSVLAFRR